MSAYPPAPEFVIIGDPSLIEITIYRYFFYGLEAAIKNDMLALSILKLRNSAVVAGCAVLYLLMGNPRE